MKLSRKAGNVRADRRLIYENRKEVYMEKFVVFIPIIIIALLAAVILLTGYVKASPDKAVIISG